MNSYAARNDPYFLRNGLHSSGELGFPLIKRQEVDIQNISLIPYHLTKPNDKANKNCGVHFFLDDYRFEEVYDKPDKAFNRICNYNFFLGPDFSIYKEMKRWKIIENIAKARWTSSYWQEKGKTVIPTISWAGPSSFDIVFSGIEKGCIVAVSTVGIRFAKFDFLLGYNQMLKVINPSKIICVGKPYKEMTGEIVYIQYKRDAKILSQETIKANYDLHKEENPFLPFDEFVFCNNSK